MASPSSGRSRRGAILVVVCAGLGVLLLFASIAIDVGYWFLTRARLNAMSKAAANAGYEILKTKDFNYKNNKAAVDAAIRAYLRHNGATDAEAAAASITVDRRGEITVSMSRDAQAFFSALGGVTAQAVAGKGLLQANNVAPFGVPTTYQDPDQDGMPNWVSADETISTSITPWAFRRNKPYIIKFGEGNRTGLDKHLVFIPMDDQPHSVALPDGSYFTLPAQDTGGSVVWYGDQPKSVRDLNPGGNIGLLRAYGVAYDVLGLPRIDTNGDGVIDEKDEKPPVQWILGYDGGAFTISEDALQRAGYTLKNPSPDGNGTYVGTLEHATKGNTHVVAVQLKVNVIHDPGAVRQKDVNFVEHLGDLMDANLIHGLAIDYQPKIATFTEYEDPVTATMINAGIPFHAFFLDEAVSVYHTFGINPVTENSSQILAKMDNASNGGPFDWLHLHHENFIQKMNGIYIREYEFHELCEDQVYDTGKNFHFVESRSSHDTDGDGVPDTELDIDRDGASDDVYFLEDTTDMSQYENTPPLNVNDVWGNLVAATPNPPPLVENCEDLLDPLCGLSGPDGTIRWRLLDVDRDGLIGDGAAGERCMGMAMEAAGGAFVEACENRRYGTIPNYHLWESRMDMDGDGTPEGFDINQDGDANDIFFAEAHTCCSQQRTYGGWTSLALHLNYREPIPFVEDTGGNPLKWRALDFNGDGIIGTDFDSDGTPDIDIDGDGTPDAKACFGDALRHGLKSGQHYLDKEELVYAFWRHVAERDGFLFAACWATDTLDSALARLGSPGFVFPTGSTYDKSYYLFSGAQVPLGDQTQRRTRNKPEVEAGQIKYDYTFAFKDFYLRDNTTYMGSHTTDMKEISEIEYGESSTQHYLVDYMNPLLQNHMGYLGIELREENGAMGTPDGNDHLIKQGGATDAFRHRGLNASGHPYPDIIKTHIWPTGGNANPMDEVRGGVPGGKVMMLAQKRDSATRRMESNKALPMVYLSGIAYDVAPDGQNHYFGRWSYLGGHGPARGYGKSTYGSGFKYRFACEGHEYSRNDYFMEATSFIDINGDGDKKDIRRLRDLGAPMVLPGSSTYRRELGDLDGDGVIGNPDGTDKCFNMSLRYTVQTNSLEGMRIYLNNILFGATVKGQGGKIPNSGAINPAGLVLGDGPGQYGNVGFTANNFATTMKIGVKKIGLPIGAQFSTAPGDLKGQVENATDYLFKDEDGNRDSITWNQFQGLSQEDKDAHKQVATIAIIERIPNPARVPTPAQYLTEFMNSNSARDKSIYAGHVGMPNTDPRQARDVHLIGFSKFFLIDPANQGPLTQDPNIQADYVATKWRDGEIRGYFLDYIEEPTPVQIYPPGPVADPR